MTASNSDIISVSDLVKKFGAFSAVKGITFSLKRGEIFGFLGSNGSGKSTTIRMLCGILRPTSGQGTVAGHDIRKDPEKIKHSIGYMSQKFSLYKDLTPTENIRFYLGIYSIDPLNWEERTQWALALSRLTDVKDRLTSELPPGWRQRLALSCALLHKPDLLFLDEPTSGVDPLTRRHFWDFIGTLSKTGVTVFVTTHYMDEAMNCERIAMINEGEIVAMDGPAELIRNTYPDRDDKDLNDVFIHLMSRRKH